MIVLGIDPGLDGGLVALDERRTVLLAERMPTLGTGKRTLDLPVIALSTADLLDAGPVRVVLEKQAPRPRDGKVSAFKTGFGYGQLCGLFAGLRLPVKVVAPRDWQRVVCRSLPKMDTKARTILAVEQQLPELDLTPGRCRKPHTGLADAAGLALWGLG